MLRIAAVLIGVCGGLAIAYRTEVGRDPIATSQMVVTLAEFEKRLEDLEVSLAQERYEREVLADEFRSVADSMALQVGSTGDQDGAGDDLPARRFNTPLEPPNPAELDEIFRQQQLDRFIAAGLPPDQAQAIQQREAEVEMDALRQRFAAIQAGATPHDASKITPLALLRSELGDENYARYLEARGRPTSVSVRQVSTNSAAELAGLRPGDEIIAYNGQRTFSMSDLTELTQELTAETTVPLEIIRSGQTMQIYVKTGPIGIGDGGRL